MTSESGAEHVPAEIALTVVVPVFNGADTMRAQLDALVAQRWDRAWEVLVVDNDSTDETPTIIEEYVDRHERFRTTRAPGQHNLAYVRNVAVADARGRSVAFCDDDDEVGDGWVGAIGTALDDHRVVASCMEYELLSDPDSLEGRGDFQSRGVERLFGYPIVNGASGWRRDLWLSLGGNDEALDFAGEDHDMALRAHLAEGVEPFFCKEAVYHCRRRSGFAATFRQAQRYGRSQALLYRRYGQSRPDVRLTLPAALARWWWLATHVLALRDRSHRTLWAWRAGLRVGRLSGSFRQRVRYL